MDENMDEEIDDEFCDKLVEFFTNSRNERVKFLEDHKKYICDDYIHFDTTDKPTLEIFKRYSSNDKMAEDAFNAFSSMEYDFIKKNKDFQTVQMCDDMFKSEINKLNKLHLEIETRLNEYSLSVRDREDRNLLASAVDCQRDAQQLFLTKLSLELYNKCECTLL